MSDTTETAEQKRCGGVLAERAGNIASRLADAAQAARNLRDRALTIDQLGVRAEHGDREYLRAESTKLREALDYVREDEPGGSEEDEVGYVTGYVWKRFLQ